MANTKFTNPRVMKTVFLLKAHKRFCNKKVGLNSFGPARTKTDIGMFHDKASAKNFIANAVNDDVLVLSKVFNGDAARFVTDILHYISSPDNLELLKHFLSKDYYVVSVPAYD